VNQGGITVDGSVIAAVLCPRIWSHSGQASLMSSSPYVAILTGRKVSESG
jgi:hypothetical protein